MGASLPLSGIKVLDFTHILAGPFCTQLLADAGARVVKVEPPGGEWARRRGPKRIGSDGRELSSYYAAVNRGKRSVVLDLKNAAGLTIARRLAAESDVVIENFSPGTLGRLGLDFTDLRTADPKLITVSINLFGADESAGELASRGGLAVVAEAESSIMSMHRDSEGRPITVRYGLGDMVSGLAAFGATSAALYARALTGMGQHIEIPMVRSLLAVNAISITGEQIVSEGQVEAHEQRTAGMGLFEAKDGYVTIGVNSDSLFARLVKAMGRSDLLTDPEFANYRQRDAHVDEFNAIVSNWTSRLTVDEIITALSPTGVPCGRVNTPGDVLAAGWVSDLNLLVSVDDGIGGTIRSPTNPFGFGPSHGPIPQAGQHTREIVKQLFPEDADAYEQLSALGAFGGPVAS